MHLSQKVALNTIVQIIAKVVTVVFGFLTMVILILALNLKSQKTEEEPTVANTPKFTPSAEPSQDTSTAAISKKVQEHNSNLDNLVNYQEKLNYPIVDLDIDFEK